MASIEASGAALDRPLSGVRVIDCATGTASLAGRLLSELGADVIRIEPPSGFDDRRVAPLYRNVSLAFVAYNLGKRAFVADLSQPQDRAVFDELVASADILIDTSLPRPRADFPIDVRAIVSDHPELVVLSISDFGLDGPLADAMGSEPVFHALSGELARSGLPGRQPLLPPGDLAGQCAATHAVFMTLVAYSNRLRTGLGDHLDLSILDASGLALDPGYGIAGSATAGVPPSKFPRGRPDVAHRYPIFRCADGYVRMCILAPRQWDGLFEWMGRPAEFADPAFRLIQNRFASSSLLPAISAFVLDKTRHDLEREGQRHGVPIAALLALDETLASDHLAEREAFRRIEILPGVEAPFPNGVFEIDGRRAGPAHSAPALAPIDTAKWLAPPIVSEEHDEPGRPLRGLRVLNLGVIVVGAEQSRLMADQGADVVKVENQAYPDGNRQTHDGSLMSVTFAAGHRNQRALAIDLRSPEGKALFLRLVAEADVVLSNFKPGVMDALGLSPEALAAANPALVMSDSSAFGASGPWSRRMGYGPLVRASTGLSGIWRYDDDPAGFSDAVTVYPDHVAGRISAIGVLALLIRRRRTGRGGRVSVSQAEVILSHMASAIAARALDAGDGSVTEHEQDAPWGVFSCAGDDEWCVVTVRDDSDWKALCDVLQRDDLSSDTALATKQGRREARQRIDTALGEWLSSLASRDAMKRLQAAGVPAAVMLRVVELPDYPHYVARRQFRSVAHPMLREPFHVENSPVHSRLLPEPPQRSAPLIGEHSAEILSEWIGLDATDIELLVASGVVQNLAAQ